MQSFFSGASEFVCAKLGDQPMRLRTELPFREIQTGWREVAFCKAAPCEHFIRETDYVKSLLHAVGGCEYDSAVHGAVASFLLSVAILCAKSKF